MRTLQNNLLNNRRCFIKKANLKHFTLFAGKRLCWSPLFNDVAGPKVRNFVERDSSAGVFLLILRFFKKSTYFEEHLRRAASVLKNPFYANISL